MVGGLRWGFIAVSLAWVGIGVGCDGRKPEGAAAPTDPQPAMTTQPASLPPLTTRPTTQELVGGKHTALKLGAFPLKMDVPESWKLNTVGSVTLLEGEAPHGEVHIQLAAQGAPLKPESMAAMEKRVKEVAAKNPTAREVVPLRPIGGTAKVMEQRDFLLGIPIRQEEGTTAHVDRVDWSVLVFVPQGREFAIDALTFMGMSLEQYKQDKEFLEAVLQTLRFDGTGGAADEIDKLTR